MNAGAGAGAGRGRLGGLSPPVSADRARLLVAVPRPSAAGLCTAAGSGWGEEERAAAGGRAEGLGIMAGSLKSKRASKSGTLIQEVTGVPGAAY